MTFVTLRGFLTIVTLNLVVIPAVPDSNMSAAQATALAPHPPRNRSVVVSTTAAYSITIF